MDNFSRNIIGIYGENGRVWLAKLPDLVIQLEKKWHLTEMQPFENLSYNYVLKAYQKLSNTPVVIKFGFDVRSIQNELNALQAYNGNGCVQVLDYDDQYNALLLERVQPGISLKSYFPAQDEKALMHTVTVMQQLHAVTVSQLAQFSTLFQWLADLDKPNTIPEKNIRKARDLASYLLNTQSEMVLLHGDLHHDNILSSERDNWISIDPKGVIGEPAFEVGAFIRNPIPELWHQINPKKIIARRLEQFSELLFLDKQRLKEWSYVQAVLAACWAFEDNVSWKPFVEYADIIDNS